MNRDTKHVLASLAILFAVVAAAGFLGNSDYANEVAMHDERCERMKINLNDAHRAPEDRRGWPEQYPGQYAAECDGGIDQ